MILQKLSQQSQTVLKSGRKHGCIRSFHVTVEVREQEVIETEKDHDWQFSQFSFVGNRFNRSKPPKGCSRPCSESNLKALSVIQFWWPFLCLYHFLIKWAKCVAKTILSTAKNKTIFSNFPIHQSHSNFSLSPLLFWMAVKGLVGKLGPKVIKIELLEYKRYKTRFLIQKDKLLEN